MVETYVVAFNSDAGPFVVSGEKIDKSRPKRQRDRQTDRQTDQPAETDKHPTDTRNYFKLAMKLKDRQNDRQTDR